MNVGEGQGEGEAERHKGKEVSGSIFWVAEGKGNTSKLSVCVLMSSLRLAFEFYPNVVAP